MMNKRFEFFPLSQLADKFPEGSWWAKFYGDFSDDQLVAYYGGDLTLPSLNLDWEEPFPEQKEVILIFIDGNFTVGHLYNKETDAAIGLMVIGNLSAKNITAGGQEIYVSGNLAVEELFCGSYNHGETIVKGHLNVAVLVQDDEYRINVDGQKSIPCIVSAWDGDGVFQELPVSIHEVLIDEVFDMDEDDTGFSFWSLVNVIAEGRSPLKSPNESFALKQPASIYFTHNAINEENILKLTQCILMPKNKPSFDFQEQDAFFKVQTEHIDADGEQRDLSVYMNDNRNHYYIWVEPDHSVGLLTRTIEEGSEWEDITEESPPEQLAELGGCWTMLLTCVNMAELYLRNVEVQSVQSILQHPAIQEFLYEEEEDEGLWDGSKYYTFRKAYVDEDGDYQSARIEIKTPDEAYYFYVLDNEDYVSRYYQPPDECDLQDMSFLDLRRWEASERYFTRFKDFIADKLEESAES
ncbi:hypothetical protein ACX93W_22970 [Paenibacillus sp. CAU 1782]